MDSVPGPELDIGHDAPLFVLDVLIQMIQPRLPGGSQRPEH